MSYQKALREKLGPLAAQMRAIVDRCDREGKRGLNSAERQKFHALETDYTSLQESIEAAEKSTSIMARLSGASGAGIDEFNGVLRDGVEELRDTIRIRPQDKKERLKDPHYKAFSNYLRSGDDRLSHEDRITLTRFNGNLPSDIKNTMSTTTGSQGGYVIPQGFSGLLEEAQKWVGGILGETAEFTTETGNPFPWPTINDTTNQGRWIGQNTQVTETDLTFGQVTFNAYIGSSDIVLVPLALMEDSYFDFDALLARLLGIRIARLKNSGFTVGSGTNQPTGIVTAAVTAGNVLQLATGNTTSVPYGSFVDLEHSVDPAYRKGAKFMMSDGLLKATKKLVDSNGRPIWQPGLTASLRIGAGVQNASDNGVTIPGAALPTILDYPYVINSAMATPAASAYSGLFGDLSTFKTRKIAGGETLMVLRERYADYLQIGAILWTRTDSNLLDAGTNPVAVLQQSAS